MNDIQFIYQFRVTNHSKASKITHPWADGQVLGPSNLILAKVDLARKAQPAVVG
jgi:hypothetical protein